MRLGSVERVCTLHFISKAELVVRVLVVRRVDPVVVPQHLDHLGRGESVCVRLDEPEQENPVVSQVLLHETTPQNLALQKAKRGTRICLVFVWCGAEKDRIQIVHCRFKEPQCDQKWFLPCGLSGS